MPPTCAILCLILGLGGLLLFVVGFALPYWIMENIPTFSGQNSAAHGLWQATSCVQAQCTTVGIKFGVTAEFEAGRVFSCATVAVGIVSFVFTAIFVHQPRKMWAIRCAVVWSCTALFNLMAIALIGATENKTLSELKLPTVDASADIAPRLAWGYWVTVASLVIFVLLSLCCAILACIGGAKDDDGAKNLLTKSQKKARRQEANMQADRLARLDTAGPGQNMSSTIYPNLNNYMPSTYPDNMSMTTTTKTADVFLPPSHHHSAQPSMYSVNKTTSGGYSIQPSSAAVNIDNRNPMMSALDGPYYSGGSLAINQDTRQNPTYYNNGSIMTDVSLTDRVVLNRPNLASTTASAAPSLSLPARGNGYQDSLYSLNVNANGIAGYSRPNQPSLGGQRANPASGFTLASTNIGPPEYSTFPGPGTSNNNLVATFNTDDIQYRL